jgi:predicted membrane-bound mannosyltransferase
MPLIGFLALILVPLYIPIAVSIIGGVRRWRQTAADTRPTVAAMHRGSEDAVPNAAWPVVEPA